MPKLSELSYLAGNLSGGFEINFVIRKFKAMHASWRRLVYEALLGKKSDGESQEFAEIALLSLLLEAKQEEIVRFFDKETGLKISLYIISGSNPARAAVIGKYFTEHLHLDEQELGAEIEPVDLERSKAT